MTEKGTKTWAEMWPTLLVPLTAIPLDIWMLGEQLLLRHFAGALVIGFSLLVIDGRLLRWFTRDVLR